MWCSQEEYKILLKPGILKTKEASTKVFLDLKLLKKTQACLMELLKGSEVF